MKEAHKEKFQSKANIMPKKENELMLLPAGFFGLLLFLVPLFLDIKLTRPKLMLLEFGLYGVLFLWICLSVYSGKLSLKKTNVLLPALVYLAGMSVFYYFSPDKPVALNEFKRALLSFTGYLVAANIINTEKQRYFVLSGWLLGAFLAVTYGILQHYGGIKYIVMVPQMERSMSTFGNPIFFAAFLVTTLPLALGLFFATKNKTIKTLLLGLMFMGIMVLFFTKTRAAYIGFGISLIVFFFYKIKSNKTKLVLLAVFTLFGIFFVYKTKNIWLREQAHGLIWRDTLTMWAAKPVFGTGPGTFHIYFPKYASEELKKLWPQGQFIVNDAHNEYIQYLSETGIVGFGIFLWILIAFAFYAFKETKKAQGAQKYIMSGLLASASGLLVQNFFSADMRFIISAVYLFIIMGLFESYKTERWRKENISGSLRVVLVIILGITGYYVYGQIAKPYLAQKKVAATPDFFDEKILEPAKTVAALLEIAKKYPEQALVYEKLGWVYAKEKNWNEAIKNYSKASEINPENAGPYNNLGNIYFLLGNRQKAIEYWARSLAVQPNQVDSRLNLATAYFYQGRLKEAVDQLKEVLRMDPDNEKAIVMLKQMTE